jgi:hypothetical protein
MKPQENPSMPQCYGNMFPSLATVAQNRKVEGKVFGYRVNAPGVVASLRTTTIDAEAWQQCIRCRDFDTCYRLSLGALLTEMALKG